jgi:exopolysaccharide production protein ExoQ
MSESSLKLSRAWPPLLPMIVGFYLAARLCITFLFFQSDPKLGAYASFAALFVLFACVLLYSFGPASNSVGRMLQARPLQWVLAFLFMGLCSLTWSATVSEEIAIAYWCELAATTVMMILLLRAGDISTISTAVMHGYVFGAIVIAAVEWLSPTMYDLRPGDDDFFSPNAIGFTCAFAVFLIQIAGRSSIFWRILAALLAVSLLRSLSKTTLIAFVSSQALLIILDRSKPWATKLFLSISALGVVSAFFGLIENYYEVYTHLGNQSETLSGRIGIWAFVLERSVQQPWIGHGFHSFRNVIPPFGSFEAWHAHNEWIQQFYTYGILGVLLVGCLYASLLRQFLNTSDLALKARLVALWVFILIRGLADTENFDLSFPLWSIAIISVMLAHVAAPAPELGRNSQESQSRLTSGTFNGECTT